TAIVPRLRAQTGTSEGWDWARATAGAASRQAARAAARAVRGMAELLADMDSFHRQTRPAPASGRPAFRYRATVLRRWRWDRPAPAPSSANGNQVRQS